MTTTPENYLKELLECTEEVYEHFCSKRDFTNQREDDLKRGLFRRRDGTTIPLSDYEPRAQFENHELLVLESYLILAKEVLSQNENRLTCFILRPLYEIGFTKIDILFSNEVSGSDRDEFKLIDSLSDLLGFRNKKYLNFFLRLLDEERSKLLGYTKKIFEKAEESIKNKGCVEYSLLKEIRQHLNRKVSGYKQKVTLPKLLSKIDFEAFKIIFSHLLHANPILVNIALDPEFSQGNKNQILIMLWNIELNVLIRIKPFVTDIHISTKIDTLLNNTGAMRKELRTRRKTILGS